MYETKSIEQLEKEFDVDVNVGLSLEEAEKHCADGQFAPGSMLPKVKAAMKFVTAYPEKKAIITSLDKAIDALNGKTGTVVTFK